MDQRNLYRVVSIELLNNYVRQGCEREAGKQKHNRAKHRVWIFDRRADSAIRLSALADAKEFSYRRSPQATRRLYPLIASLQLRITTKQVHFGQNLAFWNPDSRGSDH